MIGSYQDSVQMFGCRLTYYQSDIQSRQSPPAQLDYRPIARLGTAAVNTAQVFAGFE
ncbi:Uncharacterised protein [Neisseria meningitidis]|nr:Uncharacterised protein [Neisseria meningitidis]